jgi:hypothetical protein
MLPRLNYVSSNGLKNFLWRGSIDDTKPQLLAELGDEEIDEFALSPDGSSVGLIRGKWIHDAVLVEGLR